MKIIYDFGSNNGDDIDYYLKKADLVIAVEANPLLCDVIRSRYDFAIRENRLIVENIVLTDGRSSGLVSFFRHKYNDVLSQFPPPAIKENFEEIFLPSRSVIDLIASYGQPHYIKIDIEHYDQVILKCLFESDIKPPYISCESHSIDIFALLVSLGGYKRFKLVDGASVSKKYKDHLINTKAGKEVYSFPHHSAGPFADDISGDWFFADVFFRILAVEGLGWKDIHATKEEVDHIIGSVTLSKLIFDRIIRKIYDYFL